MTRWNSEDIFFGSGGGRFTWGSTTCLESRVMRAQTCVVAEFRFHKPIVCNPALFHHALLSLKWKMTSHRLLCTMCLPPPHKTPPEPVPPATQVSVRLVVAGFGRVTIDVTSADGVVLQETRGACVDVFIQLFNDTGSVIGDYESDVSGFRLDVCM